MHQLHLDHGQCFMTNCQNRLNSSLKQNRLGQPSLWPLYLVHVGNNWNESDKDKPICQPCFIEIRCHAKCDKTNNFKRKVTAIGLPVSLSSRRTRSKHEIEPVVVMPHPLIRNAEEFRNIEPESSEPLLQDTFSEEPELDIFGEEFESEEFPPCTNSDSIVPCTESQLLSSALFSQSISVDNSQMSNVSTISTTSTIKNRRLTDIQSVVSTQKACFICQNVLGRARIPKQAFTQVWMEKEILIPHDNRCCSFHLIGKKFTDEAMGLIISTRNGILMSDDELCKWILELSKINKDIDVKRRRFNFDNPNDVPETDYPSLVGFLKVDFDFVLAEILPHVHNSINRTTRNALAIFLMFLRHDFSQNVLQILFGVSTQSCISDTISTVAEALNKSFVKTNIGFQHLPRAEALRLHSRNMYFTLFEETDRSKIFLIMDATYIYIEKPRDHEIQKLTYSGQKKRNLVKPFMIVLPSGYILEASGPWYATGANNDAGILKAIISTLPADSEYLLPGDHDVLDREFRDVITLLHDLDHKTHMPELMNPKEKQFTTIQGNESRRVTLLRWLVEAVNGRIKKKFKFFRNTVPGGYLEKIGLFFQIACSLINKFCPPLSKDSSRHDRIADRALDLVDRENFLQVRIDEEKMDRNTKSWKKASIDVCLDFPQLSLEDLEMLTLGVYQISLAKRYTMHHMNEDSEFEIRVNEEFAGVVRAKIESRFTGNKVHNLWIEYDGSKAGVDSIVGYYCRCKQGCRTVGCCAHICSVIWFLGYHRHQVPCRLKIRDRRLAILDAKTFQENADVDSSSEEP